MNTIYLVHARTRKIESATSQRLGHFSRFGNFGFSWRQSITRALLFFMVLMALQACAAFGIETGYRNLTINNHQFDPVEVIVPKNTPFILTIAAIDNEDAVISAPDLGISRLRIPATARSLDPTVVTRSDPIRSARLPLGPMQAGRYLIVCECHGKNSEATLIVR